MKTVTTAAREAIAAGHKVYSCEIAFKRELSTPQLVKHEQEYSEQDAFRTIEREQGLTKPEVLARYDLRWSKPYTTETDKDGQPVPLDNARWIWRRLTIAPRRAPRPWAVYTARRPLAEAGSLGPAIVAAEEAHSAEPLAIRLHPRTYADYVNGIGLLGFGEVACQGVPVEVARGVGEHELVVVFPLPTEE